MKYSLDTSAILDGWRRYYPPDVFPPLYDWLAELIASGDLRASEEVLHELEKKDDAVHGWVRTRVDLFVPTDEAVQREAMKVLANHKKLIDTRPRRSSADPFVIAVAKLNDAVVVTGELATNSLKRPNIPDVCDAMGLESTNLLGLCRREGLVFG